jgi:sirohydrochlorin ferrochelatase
VATVASVGAGPVLVVCGHGTRDAAGRAAVAAAVRAVAERLPDVDVREAYVDVHGPSVTDVVAALPRCQGGGLSGVVVPLLLATGYHVRVDIARAVAVRPDVVATRALGPDDRLVDLLGERLAGAQAPDDSAVVLAPAGSSDDRAQADSAEMARRLADRTGRAVRLAFAAGERPSVAEAVAAARAEGAGHVTVVSFLLAPGVFQRRTEESGADVVTGPLLPAERVVDIVVDRYLSSLTG